MYAEVCVNTPLGRKIGPSLGADREAGPGGRSFTYAVPERLAGRLKPGHLVWVPFRSRRLQAVVLELTDQPPGFDTREIAALVWAHPVLTSTQLKLAYWVSDYYLAPLIESLRLMLPVRISQRGRTVLARTREPAPPALTCSQAELLAQIAEGEGTWAEVSAGLKVTQKADLEPLITLGLVAREVAFASPPPRPRVDRRVRLLADPPAIARALPVLGQTSIEADILHWLAGQADPVLPMAELCAALGCTPSRVRTLSGHGSFALLPARTLVHRTAFGGDVRQPPAKPAHARKQATALALLPEHLVDEADFRAQHGIARVTLNDLISDGLAERIEEPAQVRLTLAREAVAKEIIRLRGAEKHSQVLAALQRHEGPPWIGWVYSETAATLDTLRDLEAAGLIAIEAEVIWRDPLAGREFKPAEPPVLTADQERAWASVLKGIDKTAQGSAFLLFGVTGSGKTEIYLRGITEVLRRGRQAVVLVPEIALTPQTVQRFAARFPGKVTVWHSDLSDGERFDVWRRVRGGHPAAQVVVGSRSALFLPFPELGLIVVDEEHESSYKQQRTPRYHARRVAIELRAHRNHTGAVGQRHTGSGNVLCGSLRGDSTSDPAPASAGVSTRGVLRGDGGNDGRSACA